MAAKALVKKSIPLAIVAVMLLAGCKPAGRLCSSLQYHNIHLRLVKSVMTMTTGSGKTDMRRLMEQETYEDKVVRGHVTVEYPKGLDVAAKELAGQFDKAYPFIKDRLGIEWSFDLVLKLVRIEPKAGGYRYSVKLGRNRKLTFPVPVSKTGPNMRWSHIIAHEMTEASMIAPRKRSGLVLADLYTGPFCVPTGARWFRDGTSDYAQYLLGQPMPGNLYPELNTVRERLLSWANCDKDDPDWYDAAAGLIVELTNRYGDDTVKRIMKELSKEPAPGGAGLNHAVRRATGVDIREFLKNYETPWAGFAAYDSGGMVRVSKVYPATPASRRGIEPGDTVLNFAGEQVSSSDSLAHILARQRPGQMVSIEVLRGTETVQMRLKLIPMPVDMGQFLRLSGVSVAEDPSQIAK
ncbi:MAG: PDZ domain-containing protein [Armatimonadota bacterium]